MLFCPHEVMARAHVALPFQPDWSLNIYLAEGFVIMFHWIAIVLGSEEQNPMVLEFSIETCIDLFLLWFGCFCNAYT